MSKSNYDEESNIEYALSNKLHDIKQCRVLSTEITESGAKLYDLLGKEQELK